MRPLNVVTWPLLWQLFAAAGRLKEINGWLPSAGSAYLRSGDEQAQRFSRYPGVVEVADSLGKDCSFDLSLVAPSLPPYPCPNGA